MLVKTPAIKLGVEVRESRVEDGRLILAGVANAMPCTVEIGGKELVRLAGKLMRPAVVALALRSMLSKSD
ncbi:MAG: hypothetical protein IPN84_12295 [Sphingomonadales bacterium]|jgi:hypothetical protein|nr:hypothetical protein [Sphingomonadales bacterium]